MRKFLSAGLLAAAMATAAQGEECSKVVVSADSDYAPLHWYDGKHLTGASIEIASRALTALGIPFEVRYVGPFHRVLKDAQSGEVAMIASLKNTPERQQYLAFTSVPLFSNPIAVFVARDRGFSYSGWKDLVGKRGAITMGNQFGEGFDEFLRDNLKVEQAQKAYMNFSKLDAGSIDYLITGYYSGVIYLNQTRQADRFMPLKPYVTESDNFIALSKVNPCVKYLPRINAQLETMKKRGELQAILERYTSALKIEAPIKGKNADAGGPKVK
ncbi:transporter substrate-binding domain-containing protein [Herbaspirillum sp.]|uniref:substrate-binding periplasmic protein n=1 Tax=Herbaspirillum sp. TaxID=1890675 RepID=UPI0031E4060F